MSVRYPGASAEVVESQIAKTLEDSIAGIDAVDVITSVSRAEQAQSVFVSDWKKMLMPPPLKCVIARHGFAIVCRKRLTSL